MCGPLGAQADSTGDAAGVAETLRANCVGHAIACDSRLHARNIFVLMVSTPILKRSWLAAVGAPGQKEPGCIAAT